MDKLEAGKQLALRAAPYFRDVIASVKWVITDKMPETFACDKYWRVYCHPKAIDRWSPENIAWVILHECGGHIIRGHHEASKQFSDEYSAEQINIAQDLEIESWSWGSPCVERPEDGVHPSKYKLPEGETWQWYLKNLPKGKKGLCECGSGAHGAPRDWEIPPGPDDIKPGSAQEKIIKDAAAKAIAKAKSCNDKVHGSLEIWADQQLQPPKVDWKSLLRSVICGRISAGVTDMIGRPKPKYGLLRHAWRSINPNVAIVADTSGSMWEDGGKVMGACLSICKAAGNIDICWTDTKPIWQTSVFCHTKLKPVGGGSTDISGAITEAQSRDYDLIIIITDCETPWPESSDRCLVIATSKTPPPTNWRTIYVN